MRASGPAARSSAAVVARIGQLPSPRSVHSSRRRHLRRADLALLTVRADPLRLLRLRSRTGDAFPDPTAKRIRVRSKRFRSAVALAERFGAPVCEPSRTGADSGVGPASGHDLLSYMASTPR
jgi:hypothetical protein